jgi:hypothetical protein
VAQLADFVKEAQQLAHSYAERSGLPPDRFLSTLMRSIPKSPHTQNGWNAYQGFAASTAHRTEELRRIRPDYDPETTPFPTLSNTELSAMYKKFQEAFPEGEAEAVLAKFSLLSILQQDESMQDRQRQFQRICKGLRASVRHISTSA